MPVDSDLAIASMSNEREVQKERKDVKRLVLAGLEREEREAQERDRQRRDMERWAEKRKAGERRGGRMQPVAEEGRVEDEDDAEDDEDDDDAGAVGRRGAFVPAQNEGRGRGGGGRGGRGRGRDGGGRGGGGGSGDPQQSRMLPDLLARVAVRVVRAILVSSSVRLRSLLPRRRFVVLRSLPPPRNPRPPPPPRNSRVAVAAPIVAPSWI